MSFYKTPVLHLGDVKETDVTNFKFEIKDGINTPVQYVQIGCGCTSLLSKPVNGEVIGTLNIKNSGFNKETRQIHKTITVFFDDGEPEALANNVGKRVNNPSKMKQVLTLTGNVLKED